ncbi:hypothetical protein [Desulfosoma caldarium]|uniref:Uncharacterized protein n=1 Tax=Desulfosoma caldarium TaxID=610254 RepID=A0A3N1UW09_9BACT|nr:hypothetical protein [Desulfosoma caldarium]ROQ92101.1 hypothetical protein EDC27_1782 [Desulfosoma caldarium]
MKMKLTLTVADNGNLQIHMPIRIRRMRGRHTVIASRTLDGEITGAQEPVPSGDLQTMGRAFSWADIHESGQINSISELASILDVDGSYVAHILKLTTLPSDIVEALINGEEPNGQSPATLPQTFFENWAEPRRRLALPPTGDRTGDHSREPTIGVDFFSLGGRKADLTAFLFTAETVDFEKNVRLRHRTMTHDNRPKWQSAANPYHQGCGFPDELRTWSGENKESGTKQRKKAGT